MDDMVREAGESRLPNIYTLPSAPPAAPSSLAWRAWLVDRCSINQPYQHLNTLSAQKGGDRKHFLRLVMKR
jgi:hypothetical protein